MRALATALLIALLAGPAFAISAVEQLDDTALESRARVIFKEAALPGLPEPVDRRIERHAGQGPATSGA